jgi:hypothetical protein
LKFSKVATVSEPAKVYKAYKEEEERKSEREKWEIESGYSSRSSVNSSARSSVRSSVRSSARASIRHSEASFAQAQPSNRSNF